MKEDVVIVILEEDEPIDDVEFHAYCVALRAWVDEVFLESQRRVPVRTGFLRDSGRVDGEEDWRTIIYEAPYAEVVEHGRGEPGEPYYFEGRRFLDGSLDDLMSNFDDHLKLALHQDFEVTEAT